MHPDQNIRLPEAPLQPSVWQELLTLPDAALLRLDDCGLILDASAALCRALAMTPDVLKGMLLTAVSGGGTRARGAERVRRLLNAGYLRYGDLPLVGSDGAPCHFSFQRIGRMADDSHIIECRVDPVQALRAPPGRGAGRVAHRGVLDAEAIEEAAERECARTRGSGITLSMLRVNIDRGKLDAGAPALSVSAMAAASSDLARQMLGLLRAEDIVGQLDDQAFVVLLPGTSARGVLRAAERLRTAIATSKGDAAGCGVTVSIGIVTTRTGRAPYRTLRARADAKCEEASSSGGNRVAA